VLGKTRSALQRHDLWLSSYKTPASGSILKFRFGIAALFFSIWLSFVNFVVKDFASTVFNGIPFFKHKGHGGHKGKTL
jgi:hypothetical protein